jgi:hypothetical protein
MGCGEEGRKDLGEVGIGEVGRVGADIHAHALVVFVVAGDDGGRARGGGDTIAPVVDVVMVRRYNATPRLQGCVYSLFIFAD